ncbi:unnamed protein product, partial [Polarella glacialis]
SLGDRFGLGWGKAAQLLAKLSPRSRNATAREEAVGQILSSFCRMKGVDTWYVYGLCVGPGNTMVKYSDGEDGENYETIIEISAVEGSDLAGQYGVQDAMGQWQSMSLGHSEVGLAAFVGTA